MRKAWFVAVCLALGAFVACSDGGDDSSAGLCDGLMIVNFEPGTAISDVEEAADSIGEVSGVSNIEVVDQNQAFEKFQELFEDRPELVENVSVEIMPQSVRLNLDGDPAEVEAVAEDAPGFSTTVGPFDPDTNELPPDFDEDEWCGNR